MTFYIPRALYRMTVHAYPILRSVMTLGALKLREVLSIFLDEEVKHFMNLLIEKMWTI